MNIISNHQDLLKKSKNIDNNDTFGDLSPHILQNKIFPTLVMMYSSSLTSHSLLTPSNIVHPGGLYTPSFPVSMLWYLLFSPAGTGPHLESVDN